MTDNYYTQCPAKISDGRFLADNRSSHRRELYNMHMNGINRASDYRNFLKHNATKIMDGEWCRLRQNSCFNNGCIHTYQTRVSPSSLSEEMSKYNSIKTGKSLKPSCPAFTDYRMTDTPMTNKQC